MPWVCTAAHPGPRRRQRAQRNIGTLALVLSRSVYCSRSPSRRHPRPLRHCPLPYAAWPVQASKPAHDRLVVLRSFLPRICGTSRQIAWIGILVCPPLMADAARPASVFLVGAAALGEPFSSSAACTGFSISLRSTAPFAMSTFLCADSLELVISFLDASFLLLHVALVPPPDSRVAPLMACSGMSLWRPSTQVGPFLWNLPIRFVTCTGLSIPFYRATNISPTDAQCCYHRIVRHCSA